MAYDFDRIFDRRNTHSAKWDGMAHRHEDRDLLPLWVADMDFQTAPPVIDALKRQAEHGIFGYPLRPRSYLEAIVGWMDRRHGWPIDPDWLTYSPGVVTALSMCVLTYTKPGDHVIVQPPVYYPFYRVVENIGRRIVCNPLKLERGRYVMDFEDLGKRAGPRTPLMILSSPHNPVGRVWDAGELRRVGDFCIENDILLVSDEVHCDLVFRGSRHIPAASLSGEIAERTITCIAPSKTFNLAGLKTSALIIPNPKTRLKYDTTLQNMSIGMDNSFGLVALEAAYTHGDEWLEELLVYLEDNMDFVIHYCEQRIPRVKALRSEGTYLIWLDCRDLNLNQEDLDRFMLERAGLWLDDGPLFGPGGEGFQRVNIACPRELLEQAMNRLERAVSALPV